MKKCIDPEKAERCVVRVALESTVIITLVIRRETERRKAVRMQQEILWKL